MKIKEHNYDEIINVFGIYWYPDGGTLCYGLPRNEGALHAYDTSKVEIIDPELSGRYIFNNDDNSKALFHHALVEENLLGKLLEYDEDAYKRFLEIIKAEGLVGADF